MCGLVVIFSCCYSYACYAAINLNRHTAGVSCTSTSGGGLNCTVFHILSYSDRCGSSLGDCYTLVETVV